MRVIEWKYPDGANHPGSYQEVRPYLSGCTAPLTVDTAEEEEANEPSSKGSFRTHCVSHFKSYLMLYRILILSSQFYPS